MPSDGYGVKKCFPLIFFLFYKKVLVLLVSDP